METRLHNNTKSDIIYNYLPKTNQNDSKFSFQSEFAKSLAYNNLSSSDDIGQNQSLDFALSFRIENKNCTDIMSSSTSSMLSASRSPSPDDKLPPLPTQLNENSIDGSSSPKLLCNSNSGHISSLTANQFRFQVSAFFFFFY